jgi:hypothetical protein
MLQRLQKQAVALLLYMWLLLLLKHSSRKLACRWGLERMLVAAAVFGEEWVGAELPVSVTSTVCALRAAASD